MAAFALARSVVLVFTNPASSMYGKSIRFSGCCSYKCNKAAVISNRVACNPVKQVMPSEFWVVEGLVAVQLLIQKKAVKAIKLKGLNFKILIVNEFPFKSTQTNQNFDQAPASYFPILYLCIDGKFCSFGS